MSEGKVAIITAGGSGMGAAAARKLAQDGYRVAILSSSGKGEALANELGGVGVTERLEHRAPHRVAVRILALRAGQRDVDGAHRHRAAGVRGDPAALSAERNP